MFEYQAFGQKFYCKKHPNSRRMTLRFDPVIRHFKVTYPSYCPKYKVLSFIEKHEDWVQKTLDTHPKRFAYRSDSQIVFMGRTYQIRVDPKRKRSYIKGHHIYISEAKDIRPQVLRALQGVLKLYVKAKISKLCRDFDLDCKKIRFRDTTSQWGSCSRDGIISLNWRLGFAPTYVLQYVVTHEVAHLKNMDHSPKYWRFLMGMMAVNRIHAARLWLNSSESKDLYRY